MNPLCFKKEEKEKRKDPDYKLRVKAEKEEYDSKFGFALVDGVLEKVGNYKVEPPGLFRGRGEHPKMGMFKDRILPKHIILNIGKGVDIPPCPLKGQVQFILHMFCHRIYALRI